MASKSSTPEHAQTTQKQSPTPQPVQQVSPSSQLNDTGMIIQEAQVNPQSLTPKVIFQLQRTLGNHAAGMLLTQEMGKLHAPHFSHVESSNHSLTSPIQRQVTEEEEEVLQGKFTNNETPAQLQSTVGEAENRTGMPLPLKAGLEALSGIDLSGIRVHTNSPNPAHLNALAYTQGQDIHVGPGQEKHLPHEGWHVVQQMQGRVKPTIQAKGLLINDDRGLEREADVMGGKALQMKEAKDLTIGSARPGLLVLQRQEDHEDHGGRQLTKLNTLIDIWFRNVDVIKDKIDDAVKGEKKVPQKSFSDVLISIGIAPFSQLVVVGPLLTWVGSSLTRGLLAETLKEGVESGLNLAAETMRQNGAEEIDVTEFTTKWKEGQVKGMNKIALKLTGLIDTGKIAPTDVDSLCSKIPKDLFSIDLGARAVLGMALSAINYGAYHGKKHFNYDTQYSHGVLKIFINIQGLKEGGERPKKGIAMIAGFDTEKLTRLNNSIREAGGLDPVAMGIKTCLVMYEKGYGDQPWRYSSATLSKMRNKYSGVSYFYLGPSGEPDTTSGSATKAFKYFRSWREEVPILAGFGMDQPIVSWRPVDHRTRRDARDRAYERDKRERDERSSIEWAREKLAREKRFRARQL